MEIKKDNVSFFQLAGKNGTHIIFLKNHEDYANLSLNEIKKSIDDDLSIIKHFEDHDEYENYIVSYFDHTKNKSKKIKVKSMIDLFEQHMKDCVPMYILESCLIFSYL